MVASKYRDTDPRSGLKGYEGFADTLAEKDTADVRKIYERAVRDMESPAFEKLHPTLQNQVIDLARAARDAVKTRAAKGEKWESSGTNKKRNAAVSDIARANQNLEQIRKKNLPIDEHHAETAKWHNLKQGAEQKLAKMPASEQHGVQEGARGGHFYVASTGAKVYVKNNPGAETVGHMSNQRFHMGLPMSCHLAEQKKNG